MSVVDTSPLEDRLGFARQIKACSDDELADLMRGARRGGILSDVMADLPAVFRADRAGPLQAVVHWRVGGREDGGTDTFELVIGDGTIAVSPEPAGEPALTMTFSPVDFIRMVTGNANPKLLFLRGRMKARGDLGLAMRLPSFFDVPNP